MSGYDSGNDSGDNIFDENQTYQETLATLPLPQSQRNGHTTQPTQPYTYPPNNPVFNGSSSPSVQVSASSPTVQRNSSATPRPPPLAKGALNNGAIPLAIAPPGTQFRPPVTYPSSQYAQTQTQRFDLSDDEGVENSSDGPDRSADIKPSSFVRGGRNGDAGPYRVQESPFRNHTSQFAYQSPPKRSADDMASAYTNQQRPPKLPRQTGPAKALPPSMSSDGPKSPSEIMDYGLAQKVRAMTKVLQECSVAQCHQALIRHRGHFEDAMTYLVSQNDESQDKKRPSNSIDLTSEGDEEPLPAIKPSTAKRDVGKSASITQKWSSTQSTKQNPTVPSRTIQEKYTTVPKPQVPTAGESIKKPGRILGRKKPNEPAESSPISSTAASPNKIPSRQQRRDVVDDDDEEYGEAGALDGEESDDSGVDLTDHTSMETRLLELINTSTSSTLLDLTTSTSPEVIDKVLAQRPFRSIEDIRSVSVEVAQTTKNGKSRMTKRKIGEKLVDTCLDMMTGFTAVDELVQECEKLGNAMKRDMKQWGLNAFGASKDSGELSLADLDSAHDSGIGTPTSTPSHDGESGARKQLLKQPKTLSTEVTLMDHQVAGLNWLALLYAHGLSGILADDMGLGKTLQVIAYLTHLNEAAISSGTHLVIVPGSTIENWLREFQNFSPSLRVEPYYGGINERVRRQEEIKQNLDDIHVVVTTYDMTIRPDDGRFLRKEVKPVVCVWDEAHALKNSQSKRYNSLIKIPAKQRLMLTGTPVQNNLAEMASLLAFLMPDVFKEREDSLQIIFKNKEKLNTAAGAGKDTQNEKSALLSADRVARARSMITPFILRRKKHQVLKSLPKKSSSVEYCKLEGDQADLYKSIEENYRRYLAAKRKDKSKADFVDDGAVGAEALTKSTRRMRTAAELEKSKDDAITSILTQLRKAAIHPLLFRRHYTDELLHKITTAFINARENKGKDYNHQYVFEDLEICPDFEIHRWCLAAEQPSAVNKFAMKGKPWLDGSAKVLKLVSLLKEHAEGGHKTLVFSQFTSVMDILELAFTEVRIAFFRLDGQTKMEQRQDMIDAFYKAPTDPKQPGACSVFMLSTGAGGQGINLACADRVVIFDSGFNPHQDLQAENRAHRVGQTRDVVVTRLVSEGTIEEQILKVGQVKVRLDEEVAGGGATVEEANDADEEVGEKQSKGMVESLLAKKLGEDSDSASATNGVNTPNGKETEGEKVDAENGDLAAAFTDRLKSAGVNVQK
ncbi:MAG: hypothetical protein Q9159_007422 [Coniocarpon cinnabarinum]